MWENCGCELSTFFYFKAQREGNYGVLCKFYQKQRDLTNVLQSFSGFPFKKGWGCGIFGDKGYK